MLVSFFVSSARSLTDAARRSVTLDVTLDGARDLVSESADHGVSAGSRAAGQRHQRRP